MQPHIRAFVERAVTFTTCPECDGTRLSEAARSSKIKGKNIADACAMQISDLAEWVQRPRRAVGRAAARGAAADPRLVRGDRARLPLARPAVGHALGRRGAAHQDDPPPRLLAHRRHLRLRRADDRPAPARRPADERPAAAAARQGQHGARRRARAGDDRDRRPRRRPRPRRRHGGRHDLLRGRPSRGCGPATPSPAAISTTAPRSRRRCGRPPARWRSAARRPTTCRTSTSTSRSGCSCVVTGVAGSGKSSLDARVDPGAARAWCRSTRPRSAARAAATRRRTPGCSTRSARRSRRPTA